MGETERPRSGELPAQRVFVTRPIPAAGVDLLEAGGAQASRLVRPWRRARAEEDLRAALASTDVVLTLLTEQDRR